MRDLPRHREKQFADLSNLNHAKHLPQPQHILARKYERLEPDSRSVRQHEGNGENALSPIGHFKAERKSKP